MDISFYKYFGYRSKMFLANHLNFLILLVYTAERFSVYIHKANHDIIFINQKKSKSDSYCATPWTVSRWISEINLKSCIVFFSLWRRSRAIRKIMLNNHIARVANFLTKRIKVWILSQLVTNPLSFWIEPQSSEIIISSLTKQTQGLRPCIIHGNLT